MFEGIRAVATILAGVGILFVGLNTFKQFTDLILVDRRFRLLLTKWVGRFWPAALTGFCLGTATLSTNTVRTMFSNLLSVRSLVMRQALAPIAWTLLGTSLIYFLFALDLETISVTCLAIGSLSFVANRYGNSEHWLALVFALGLILFGMQLFHMGIVQSGDALVSWNERTNNALEEIHQQNPYLHDAEMALPSLKGEEIEVSATSELHDSLHYWDEVYHNVAYFLRHATFFLFVVGLIASLLFTQLGGGFLAISLGGLGYLGFDQAAWMVFGVMMGGAITESARAWLLTSDSQRLSAYIAVLYLLSCLMGMILWSLEQFLGVPLLESLASTFSSKVSLQIAWIPFLVQLSMVVLASLMLPFTAKLLNRFFPQDDHADLMRPKFIHDQALSEPEFAVDLIALEEQDIAKRLPPYIDLLRKEVGTYEGGGKPVAKERLHESYQHVCKELKHFVQDLMHERISSQTAEYLLDRLEVLTVLEALEHHLSELHGVLAELMKLELGEQPKRLVQNICEVLDIFLMTTMDAIELPDEQNIEILALTSSGSGDQMKNLRKNYLSSEQALDDHGRNCLRWILFHFENYIVSTQKVATLLEKH